MLSENEQKEIIALSGRLTSTFEDLFNLQGDISESDCVEFTFHMLEMFDKQTCNLSVDLFKHIFNRLHGKV